MPADSSSPIQTCATCGAEVDLTDFEPLAEVACPVCNTSIVVAKTIGPYELVEVMGRGGMGVVYRAMDHQLARQVALKVLRIDYSNDSEFIQKLEVEAAITGGINHPHVVKVYTTGSDSGRFFIAMELVDKGTLDDLMGIQGRIAEAQALEIASQIAQGLRAAGQLGLIHRDVKPGNILFANAHAAKIVDFGLALLEEASAGAGEIWGTPYYVSPERLDRKPEDFRSDIYSLGATVFHAIAGRPPFEAEDAGLVALKHLKSQAVSLQSFAPWVAGSTAFVINRMLQKDPAARYGSYDELIEQLEYARAQLVAKAASPPQKSRVVLETAAERKFWGQVTIAIIALLLLFGGGAAGYFFWWLPSRAANRPQGPPAIVALDRKSSQQFEAARRSLASGDFSAASESFHQLAGDGQVSADIRGWSMLQAALAELFEHRLENAQHTAEPLGQLDTADPSLTEFFHKAGQLLAGSNAVSLGSLRSALQKPYSPCLTLLAGLKDLVLEDLESAGQNIRQFHDARFDGEYAWLHDYQPLIEDLFNDLITVNGAIGVASSGDPAAGVKSLRETRSALSPGPERKKQADAILIRKLDQSIQAAEAKVANQPPPNSAPPPPPAPAPAETNQTADPAQERTDFSGKREKALALAAEWKFREARDLFNGASYLTPEVRREHRTLMRKLDWLRRFKETLISDLAGGFNGTVGNASASVAKASEDGIEVRTGSGSGAAPNVPWKSAEPNLILGIAEHFIAKGANPPNGAERRYLAGAYATFAGVKSAARRLLTESVKEGGPAEWQIDQATLLMPPRGKGAGEVLSDYFSAQPASWLPTFQQTDVGLAGKTTPGSNTLDERSGVFTVRSAGQGIGGAADSFYFLHKPEVGNFYVEGRIEAFEKTSPESQFGILFREGSSPGARCCFFGVNGDGELILLARKETGGAMTESKQKGPGLPNLLRLRRDGNAFSGETSTDGGKNWRKVGDTVNVDLPEAADAGIGMASHANGAVATGRIEILHLAR